MLKIDKILFNPSGAHRAFLNNGEELDCSILSIEKSHIDSMSFYDSLAAKRMPIRHESIKATLSVEVDRIELPKSEIDISEANLIGATLYFKKGYSLVDAQGLKIIGITSIELAIRDKYPESVRIVFKKDNLVHWKLLNIQPVKRNTYQLCSLLVEEQFEA